MRTTLNLDDELVKEAKIAAIRQGRTLTALIEDAVRKELASGAAGRGKRASKARVVLPTAPLRLPGHTEFDLPQWDGSGFPEGVNTDNTGELLDYLDRLDEAERRSNKPERDA